MADKTITQLTATTSAATADEIPIWVAGSAVTRKITKANFLQGAFTGGGTIATGGFTLTVPATGTAALISSGSFTPVLRFGGASTGITYAAQTAQYVKIGTLVLCDITIALTSKGSATGSATIDTMPFTAAYSGAIIMRYIAGLATIAQPIFGLVSSTSINLTYGHITTSSMSDAHFTNSANIQLIAMYFTS